MCPEDSTGCDHCVHNDEHKQVATQTIVTQLSSTERVTDEIWKKPLGPFPKKTEMFQRVQQEVAVSGLW